ncbi:MAG: LysM peptidoglycan-binding domain-containing protein [Candidatus Muirbacterium halophilum]|nr:LysM peptidoglycan-binding domain-containing protein [Candidatus Muirbacterium halophilum]MCK9475820.1 LysM peptidoglycan-binding domain-containing protein [Candidatus Muirbacterium halophilum]
MNKKVIGIIIVVIAAILLIRTCSSEKPEIKVTDNKIEPIIQEDVKAPVDEMKFEEEDEYEEEVFQPKIEEKSITTAATIEKIEVKENIKRKSPTYENKEDFFYIVRPNDTLWSIALEYYIDPYSYQKIADYNNINDATKIYPGRKIMFPGKIVNRDYIVTVEKGETLWEIAGRIYGDNSMWKFLAGYNGINLQKRIIWPGMKLRVPHNTLMIKAIKGDDFFKISKRVYNTPLFASRLAKYNNDDYVYYAQEGSKIFYPELKIQE